MAGGDPSSHGRAGPGPRLLLGTRCPLPNSVLGCGALDHCLQPGQWLSPGVGWQGPHGFAHAGHTRPGTRGPRATAAVGRQHSHLGPKKNPNQADGRQSRDGFAREKQASSSTGSPHSLPGSRSIFSAQQSSGGPFPHCARDKCWGRDTSKHTCAILPSHGQSWDQQSRIPQETARTYHAWFII